MADLIPSSSRPPRRGFKLPAGVAMVLVLLLIGAGGWFVWTQLRPAPAPDLSQYEPVGSGAAQARARNPGAPPQRMDQVITRADGGGEVVIGVARARFNKDDKNPKGFRLELQYIDRSQAADDLQAIRARFAAISNAEQAKNAGVQPKQIEQLRAVPYTREMAAAEAVRMDLIDHWTRFRAAPEDQRNALKQPLIDTVRKAATDSLTPTLASIKQTADEVRKILTPQQIAALRGNPRRGA